MLNALSTLKFTNLIGLSSLLLVPILILAYLYRREFKRQIVSSIVVLKELSRKAIIKHTFKPPLRFFLELAVLILLAAALSKPNIKSDSKSIAIVIDTSFSMRAKAQSTYNLSTRIAKSLETALQVIENESSSHKWTVFTSAPTLKQISENNINKATAKKIISEIQTSIASDSLDISLTELASSSKYDKVLVFTDRTVSKDSKTSNISIWTNYSPLPNVYISSFAIDKNDENSSSLFVKVASFGNEKLAASIDFSQLRFNPTSNTVERKKLGKTQVELINNKEIGSRLALEKQPEKGDIFECQLSVLTPNYLDSLMEDNKAWANSDIDSTPKVLLIANTDSTNNLGLSQIPNLGIKTLSFSDFSRLYQSEVETYSLLIFHRLMPLSIPKVPSLLILPPENNHIFPIKQIVTQGKLSSWNTQHELTSYLETKLIKPQACSVFELPAWMQCIINIEQGCILEIGESQGVRFAAFGFELLPFEGLKTPSLSILTLNTLQWLSAYRPLASSILLGSSMRLEPKKTYTIWKPSQELEQIDADSKKFFEITQAGAYFFSAKTANNDILTKDNIIHSLAININLPKESDTFNKQLIVLPDNNYKERASEPEKYFLIWKEFSVFALLVILLELFIAAIQKLKRKEFIDAI